MAEPSAVGVPRRRQCFYRLRRIAGCETQAGLSPADEFQIDARRQLGINQRAMLSTTGQIDPETLAEFVERIARAGQLCLRDLDRIDGACCSDWRL